MKYSSIIFVILFLSFSLVSNSEQERKSTGLVETPPALEASFKSSSFASESKLPSSVDLSAYLPTPGNQGMQGSCVAWSVAYAYKSFHEKIERGWDFSDKTIFSPAYIYNQIHLDNSPTGGGSYIHEALELVKSQGVATLSKMPYDPNNYKRMPSEEARREASLYKAKGWERVAVDDVTGLKKVLASGNTIVIGMTIYENFYNYRGGLYNSFSGKNMGGHAMLVVGYDDSKNAFKIQNSWGTYWGDKGYAWVDYNVFKTLVKQAYVMYDVIDSKPDKSPNPPSSVSVSKGVFEGKIRIKWEPVEDADSYEVYRSLYKEGPFTKVVTVSDIEYFDNNVEFKWYFYGIKSVNKNGISILSAVDSGYPIKVIGKKEDNKNINVEKPGQVQNLRGVYEDKVVKIFWDKVMESDGYIVNRFDMNTKEYIIVAKVKETTFSETLKPGKYWYTVTGFNNSGLGIQSDTISIEVPEEKQKKIPFVPSKIKASLGNFKDKIVISWDEVEDAEFYIVKKWDMKTRKWIELAKVEMTSLEDKNLSSNEFYYYYVIAGNTVGYSNPSRIVLGYTSESSKLEEDSQKIKTTDFKTYKEKASELVQNLGNKSRIKAIVPLKDKGKKILDEFYYTDDFVKTSGYYKDIIYYRNDGKIYMLQRFYTDDFTKTTGYNSRIISYDANTGTILKVETLYVKKPYSSRISYYINNSIFKTEVYIKSENENSYGFAKMVMFHKNDLNPEWIEFYNSSGVKVKEIDNR